ncbi:hypothetical protein JCM3766R1_004189 [Sporobolomyces carnicolor]
MDLEEIREELLLLQSSLIDDELSWLDEETESAWEPALSDSSVPPPSLVPALRLRIAPDAQLEVGYKLNRRPDFTLYAANLERDDQARLAAEVDREAEENAQTIATLPVFTLFTSIKEWLANHPLKETRSFEQSRAEERRQEPPKPGPIALKCTLIWSHHLLATSKRKDIIAWSTELSLFGISKPGYPGVIVVEGCRENVDEFVWRIKQLQWKALQIRCEQDGQVAVVPDSVAASDSLEWTMRNKSQLGPVLSTDPSDKICVREVEGLNELGEIMREGGLEVVFLTALKINK